MMKRKVWAFVLVAVLAFSLMSVSMVEGTVKDTLTVFEGQKVLGKGTGLVFESEDSVSAGEQVLYTVKLFGIIPIKNVTAEVIAPTDVGVGGFAFGVKLFSDGVLVTGFDNPDSNPCYQAGIRAGDFIVAVGGTRITTNQQLAKLIRESEGKMLSLSVKRNGTALSFSVLPQQKNGAYSLGIWVKDSTAGIGTVTFVDPESGVMAGLGHGINDGETGTLMPLHFGTMVGADITGVNASKKGEPGELLGRFDEEKQFASLYKNTDAGIFGTVYDTEDFASLKMVPVGKQNDIRVGKATILCDIGEGTQEFEIEISKIMTTGTVSNKNMLLTVTDERLLEKTGGIVQGMSGSPILQNGKLVGAVTHVLVNDPAKGYGIFLENMLNAG